MNDQPISLKRAIEAILFASQKPLSVKELQGVFRGAAAENGPDEVSALGKVKESDVAAALEELSADFQKTDGPFEVREGAAGWQLVTSARFAPWVRQLFPENRPSRLSTPALETLAIIAYRQPVTRAHLEAVRGVAVDGVMQTLLDRGLIKIGGRAEVPGRPLLYETTQFFMEHFGLRNLDELPNAAELRAAAPDAAEATVPTADAPVENLAPQEEEA